MKKIDYEWLQVDKKILIHLLTEYSPQRPSQIAMTVFPGITKDDGLGEYKHLCATIGMRLHVLKRKGLVDYLPVNPSEKLKVWFIKKDKVKSLQDIKKAA